MRVSEPAYGFFITGSSIEKMNGVYVRQNAPKSMRSALPPGRLIALYYKHEEGGWTMNLDQLPEQEEEESDEDDYLYSRFSRFHEKKPTHEWVIRDEFMAARFTHDGDTIVPGAGVRWNFAVKEVPSTTGETAAAGATASTADAAEPSQTALTEIKENDEDELPWQVIAILDIETVQDLLYSSQYHKQKIREAKAGKNAPAPSVATLVGAAAPGRWLFRVVAPEGVTLHLEPDEASEEVGVRQCGEYLRAVELGGGGEWLRLGSCEDTDPNRSRSGFGKMGSARRAGAAGYYNADLSRREVWLRLCVTVGSSTKTYVEEVPASETAVLNLRGVGDSKDSNAAHASDMNVDAGGGGGGSKGSSSSEAQAAIKDKSDGDDEVDGGSGLTGDYFDKPFVPRMDDGVSGSNESELVARAAAREAENEEVLATSQSRSSFLSTAQWGVPIGAAVTVSGLKSRVGAQYNGLTGVVVTPLDAASGRQGVRLNAPFRYTPQHLFCFAHCTQNLIIKRVRVIPPHLAMIIHPAAFDSILPSS